MGFLDYFGQMNEFICFFPEPLNVQSEQFFEKNPKNDQNDTTP